MSEKFCCPKCGSEHIQSCPVIYQSGTVGHSYTSRSGNYEIDTSGTESTALAQSVAPPPQKETSWVAMIITGFLGYAFLNDGGYIIGGVFALIAIACAMSSSEASEYNEKQWPEEYRRWERSYMCHRCGNIFLLR